MKGFAPTAGLRIFESAVTVLPGRLARSARWRYLTWFKGVAAAGLDVEAIGFRWRLHPVDNVTERLMWLHRAHPEAESLSMAMNALRGRRALVVDVGANCGSMTIPLAAAAAKDSMVLAFEPNPVMLSRLRVNLHLNDMAALVEMNPVALGSEAGTAMLRISSRNLGEASLEDMGQPAAQEIAVPVRTLAEYIDGASYDVFLLKIDVEGHEAAVLVPFFEKAKRDAWPTHILIEIEHKENWSSDLFGLLKNCGYDVGRMLEGNAFLVRRS